MSLSGLQGGKTHSPPFLRRIRQAREVIRPLQRHLCVLDYIFYAGKGTYFFIDVHLEGPQTSFTHDNVKVTGARGSSLIACHMFCDIWMQFFCWVLLDPRAVCTTQRRCFVLACISTHGLPFFSC